MHERAGFGPPVSPPESPIPLRVTSSDHREMSRSMGLENCRFGNALVANHRS
jgi:hypothetical protein